MEIIIWEDVAFLPNLLIITENGGIVLAFGDYGCDANQFWSKDVAEILHNVMPKHASERSIGCRVLPNQSYIWSKLSPMSSRQGLKLQSGPSDLGSRVPSHELTPAMRRTLFLTTQLCQCNSNILKSSSVGIYPAPAKTNHCDILAQCTASQPLVL